MGGSGPWHFRNQRLHTPSIGGVMREVLMAQYSRGPTSGPKFGSVSCASSVGPRHVDLERHRAPDRQTTVRGKPPTCAGDSCYAAGCSLPADLEAGSTTRAAANGATSTVAVGDQLDP